MDKTGLTRQKKEVVQLAVEVYNDDEIAKMLAISAFTIKFHLKHIFKKLGITQTCDLSFSWQNRATFHP